MRAGRALLGLILAGALGAPARSQLRVATYNLTNYSGADRADEIRTIFYREFQGRRLAPDVAVLQEFLSPLALGAFLALINGASGSPGDWAAAPFVDGADTDSVLVYRTSKVQFLGYSIVSAGSSSSSNHPRNLMRYDLRLAGYASEAATFSLYSTHMKAGSAQSDQDRRLIEAQRMRQDAVGLPAARAFLVGGDFNIGSSAEDAYEELVGALTDGPFFDPIRTPGSWGSSQFRFVHTQDPVGGGGMDDRYDQILISAHLKDGAAFEYRGDTERTYSTSGWNDPNHSYRCWGNDGTSYNQALTVSGNTMVGPAIAAALVSAGASSGHLPVFLELLVPPKAAASPQEIRFPKVLQGFKPPRAAFTVANGADVGLWSSAGASPLRYTLSASPGILLSGGGPFAAAPGAPGNIHEIALSTARAGPYSGTVTIATDDPDQPVRIVVVSGYVIGRNR